MIDIDTLDVVWHEMSQILFWDVGPKNVIYCVKNNVSKRRYVGLTSGHFKTRIQGHVAAAVSNNSQQSLLCYAFQKHGLKNFQACVLEVVDENLSLADAEIRWIADLNSYYFDNRDIGYNMTLGGDGSTGHVTSHKTRKKLSLAQKGKPMSQAARKKLQKSIVQIDMHSGEIIKVFPSLTAASLETQVSNITYACQGKLPHAGGFIWKYANENDAKRGLTSEETKAKRTNKTMRGKCLEKQVEQINHETGEIVATFSSIKEAFEKTGICNISMCCRGVRETAGEFYWRYSEVQSQPIQQSKTNDYEPVTEEFQHPFDNILEPREHNLELKEHTPVKRIACPICSQTFGQEVRFNAHLLSEHNIDNSFQFFLDTFHDGIHPTCECSEECTEKLTWNSWKKGFTSKFVRGHNARVYTVFSNPEKAKELASKRQEGYRTGKYKVWNDGLTKKTSEKIANMAAKTVKTFKIKRCEKEKMNT